MYRTWEITWKIFSHNCPNKIIGSRFTFSWERLRMKIMVTMVWIMSNGFLFSPGPNKSAKLQKLLLKSYTICTITNEIAFSLASTFFSSFHMFHYCRIYFDDKFWLDSYYFIYLEVTSDVVGEQKSGSGWVQGLLSWFRSGSGINILGTFPSGFQVFMGF